MVALVCMIGLKDHTCGRGRGEGVGIRLSNEYTKKINDADSP